MLPTLTQLDLDCLLVSFLPWNLHYQLKTLKADEYWRILTNMRVVETSLALLEYKTIHNKTDQQLTPWAHTTILRPSSKPNKQSRSIYVNGCPNYRKKYQFSVCNTKLYSICKLFLINCWLLLQILKKTNDTYGVKRQAHQVKLSNSCKQVKELFKTINPPDFTGMSFETKQ